LEIAAFFELLAGGCVPSVAGIRLPETRLLP
jgi:hypothetical protein